MMGCMLFTYGVNMCKMKNHTMNKKSNIKQISNLITRDNMIPWSNLILLNQQVQNISFFTIHTNYTKFHMNQL
jgi:hypothetical protein